MRKLRQRSQRRRTMFVLWIRSGSKGRGERDRCKRGRTFQNHCAKSEVSPQFFQIRLPDECFTPGNVSEQKAASAAVFRQGRTRGSSFFFKTIPILHMSDRGWATPNSD